LPKPVQTFAALYASWVERLGNDENSSAWAKAARSKTLWLLVDAGCILVVIVGAALARDRVIGILDAIGLSPAASRALSFLGQLVLLAPFVVGALRCARALASIFTGAIFEKATGTGELASSSRRMLVVVLYLALILAVGTPILAISQPFLPRYSSASVFLGAIVVALFAFWRSARALDAGVRAGAQIVVDALEEALPKSGHQTGEHSIPELGTTSAIRLTSASFAAGKSLAELDLRGRTGAMVVAMERGNAARLPSAKEPLLAGDVLAVTGTKDSVEAAVLLLGGGPS
jgi:CPA2 family monovalent cation:H+ antiporter-2